MTDELIQVINDKIYFVMKQPLIDYALKKGLINKASVTKYEIMRNAMLECSSDRYIKLSDMVDSFQSHRALDDCHLCLEIIKGCEND